MSARVATLTGFADQRVQLCASHTSISTDVSQVFARLARTHLFQPKLDGMRALAIVEDRHMKLRSRTGDDITRVYPEVTRALAQLELQVVLDGELVHYGPDGLPAFTAMSWRNSQRNAAAIERMSSTLPVSFVAFDVLWLGEFDLRNRPLTERLIALDALPLSGTIQRCPTVEDGWALWEQTEALHLEGVVAKAKSSRYTGRRCQDWIKIKTVHRISAIVGNVLATERRAIGKVEVCVLDGDSTVALGEVGTGWTAKELADVARRVQHYASDPIHNSPVVIEVGFCGRYDDGKLKFASFLGVRDDIDWTTCTINQEGL